MKKRRTLGLGLTLDVEKAQKQLDEELVPNLIDQNNGGGNSTSRSKSVDVQQ